MRVGELKRRDTKGAEKRFFRVELCEFLGVGSGHENSGLGLQTIHPGELVQSP
jgi:hypothetical protein